MFKLLDKYFGIPLVFIFGLINRLVPRGKPSSDCKRILIIKTSALGDTVLLLPILKAIRKKFPGAKISMVATQRNKDVLLHDPNIDELILLEINKFISPFYMIANLLKIRAIKPDLAIDFDQWMRFSALLSCFSGAKRRLGFNTKGQFRHYLYTDSVRHRSDQHEIQCFEDLVGILNINVDDSKIELHYDREECDRAKRVLADLGKNVKDFIIGIHPGCGKKGKARAWPAENYIELIRKIRAEFPAKIILTGSKEEYKLCSNIAGCFPEGVYNIAGKISLDGLICILSDAKLFISSNNGIMHIAAALDIPLIALHGPTDPKRWGPLGKRSSVIKSEMDCSPCLYLGFEYGCRDYQCMRSISVERVFEEAKKKLRA